MSTAAELVSALDDNLMALGLGFDTQHLSGGTTPESKKIRALDRAQNRVWRAIIAGSRENRTNWFGTTAQINLASAREASLPVDCHDVLFVESNTDTLSIQPSSWDKDEWKKARQDSATKQVADLGTLYYVISGAYQPKILFSHQIATLALTVHYTQVAPAITGTGSNIDHILPPYRDAVVNYATAVLIAATRAADQARFWFDLWREDRDLILGITSHRKAEETEPRTFDLQN